MSDYDPALVNAAEHAVYVGMERGGADAIAVAVLDAVVPLIAAKAWDEGFVARLGDTPRYKTSAEWGNPYRAALDGEAGRGNDCNGPEGHREGCPVHCSCYDADLPGPDPDGGIDLTDAEAESYWRAVKGQ